MRVIELENITTGYGGEPVLRGISLSLPNGSITAILGPNGCGKSTLLKTAAGLLRPHAGQVCIDGAALGSYKPKQLAQRVAYLPQSRPVPDIDVGQLVLHGRFPYLSYPRRPGSADREIAQRAMRSVGIDALSDRLLSTLSGGERQKAYIAMALAQDTPHVLLDEPTTYLDIDRQLEVLHLCLQMRDAGKAVVMVLHDLTLAFRFADRVALMQDGAPVFTGTPSELAQSGALETVFHVRAHPISLPDGSFHYIFLESR